MKKVALIGCGNLGSIIAREIQLQLCNAYEIIGLYDRDLQMAEKLANQTDCPACNSLEQLLIQEADYVIEATTPDVLKKIAPLVLESGSDMIVLSVGAFADETFARMIQEKAAELNRKIYIASGAIGGFDIMQAAMAQGTVEASIYNIKSPEALEGAPYLEGKPLSQTETEIIFTGNAIEAIKAFPKNVNVAVALAIATVGADQTKVIMQSEPEKKLNTHRIDLKGDFGYAQIEITSTPSPENMRSSAIAAYSVVAKLKNLSSNIVFC